MPQPEHTWFKTLKKEIAETFRKTYPDCQLPIEEWKGQDIANFQEELIRKVKGTISEKWFYTHIKAQNEKLPRIDMLNMLSKYSGYAGWRDFTIRQPGFTRENEEIPAETPEEAPAASEPQPEITPTPPPPALPSHENAPATTQKKSKQKYWIIALLIILLLPMAVITLVKKRYKIYHCCVTGQNGQGLLPNAKPEIRLLKPHESPVLIHCDSSGCFELKTTDEQVRFSLSSPYYWPDTVTRALDEPYTEEQVKLRTNDYALMIHYFSASDMSDWKARKAQLEEMISPAAKIFQVYADGSGMELYNKDEFIHKMTMPLKSLKNIEIVETRYVAGQIALLRFMQTKQGE